MTDPKDNQRSGEYFLDEFFTELEKGSNFKKALREGDRQDRALYPPRQRQHQLQGLSTTLPSSTRFWMTTATAPVQTPSPPP